MVLSGALALAFGMNSCSDYDNGYTSKDIAYKEQFYNMFGNADPNHTWNMAQSRSLDVTINSEGTYTVKVWTANPRLGESNAFLLGQYDRVPGGATSSFACDMPQDVKTAYVGIIDENGDRIILPSEVKDGKVSVEFGALGTRTAFSGSSGSITYTAIDKSNGKEFQKGDMDAPLNTLPEQQQNIGKVSQDFEYVSTGEFTIYPMYSVTGNAGSDGKGERLGIYLVDGDGNKGDVVWIWQSTVNDSGTTGTATWFDGYNSSEGKWETDFFGFSTDRKQTLQIDNPKVVWGGNNFVDPYTAIRAEGVTVNIPVGTRFGMVLDASGGGPYYSNSAYNQDQGWPFPGTKTDTDGVNDVYAATFEYQGRLYLAFEDWNYGSEWHDCDFNDVVFVMPETTKKPIVIDKDTKDVSMSYIVACEDLGGTFDWDFNDVVYAIEHVSGQTTAKLKLLAAGGTLPVKISYNDNVIRFNGKEDLHEAFGVDQKTPVNVGGYSASPVYSEEFTVGADAFSMSTHASAFKIHVEYPDGSLGAQIGVPDRNAGQEPQAFLVADPNWQWPNEKVSITSVYPQFTEWVANLNTNWCGSVWGDEGNGTPTTGNVIDVKGYLTYNGNVATFPLNADQMKTYTSYQIVLQTSANATVKFFDASGNEIQMTDGNVQAGQQSTFTLSGEALNALKGGKMTITFSDGQAAQGCVTKLDWVEGTELASGNQEKTKPTFEVSPTSLTFEPEDWAQRHITCTTNSTGAVTYKSMNTGVATIDGNGNVTPVAGGKTYLVANLSETDAYHSATAYITVEVKEKELVKDEWFTNGNFKVSEWVNGNKVNVVAPRWVADPTNSDNGCIEVTTNANPSASWDAQFFVSIPENESPLKEGDKYRLTMKVRADVAQTVGSQSQSSPGNYIHYDAGVGNIDVTGEWVTITKEITVTHDMSSSDNMRTIAFNLANNTQATNYYFDDVKLEIISRANLQDPNLNLNNSTLSMYVNDTQSVGFSKNSNGAISFAYSDNTVASAALDGNNIKITGLKAGTTTITVRLDAEGNYKTVKKTIEVTVQARQQVSPNLEINNSSVDWLTVGGYVENGFRSANSAPVVLTSSNPSIVTAVESTDNNGNRVVKLTGVSAGTATVTVRQEATAEFAAAEVTIDVTIKDTPLEFYNNPSEIMDNATFNNGTLTWKYSNTNLVALFTFNNGELANYKSIHIGTYDIQEGEGPVRLVFMNGGNTVATIRLYSNGERFLNFSAREELNGVDLSAITKISIGGETASGSVQISNIYLSQAEH
ncbi:MAG: DUF4114 domain-containing protein [Bacteroidales bacterium]|nr:DUF4114 domain-containing protein [Bacteroidales bacterium]